MDKVKYAARFKELYRQETGQELSDDKVLDFENLVTLVAAISSHIPRDQISIPKQKARNV